LMQLKKKSCLIRNNFDRLSFAIKHFAGEVMYSAKDFVTRNQDTLPSSLLQCGTNCSNNSIISSLFMVEPGKKDERLKRTKSAIAGDTVWTKYKYQLSELMKNIRRTQTRYIRCIKPNAMKKPLIVEHKTTAEQLRTAGIVAGITISRSTFPNRLDNIVVYRMYNGMWDKNNYPSTNLCPENTSEKLEEDCLAMLTGLLKTKEIKGVRQFAIGRTRTYFRSGALEYLESIRQKGLDVQAIPIQRIVRGWLARKRNEDLLENQKVEMLQKKQAEQSIREKMIKEKQACNKQREDMLQKYREQINNLREQINELDVDKAESLLSLEKRSDAAKKKENVYENKMKTLHKDIFKGKKIIDNKIERIAGNRMLMQKLKKDHKRLGKVHGKIQKQHERMSLNNQKLEDSARSGSSTYSGMLPGTSDVMTKFDDLKDEKEILTNKYTKQKQEVELWQGQYWEKASMRLEVEKGLEKILTLIQKKSHNQNVVKLAENIALKCQEKCSLLMEKLDAEFGHDEAIDPTEDP